MTDTITAAHFEAALDAQPDAWDVRLQYADWLERAGKKYQAAAQRLMAKTKCCAERREIGDKVNGTPFAYYEIVRYSNTHRWNAVVYSMRNAGACRYGSKRSEVERGVAFALRYLHTEVLGLPSLEG